MKHNVAVIAGDGIGPEVLTPDMGGNATTAQVGDEVVRKIRDKK